MKLNGIKYDSMGRCMGDKKVCLLCNKYFFPKGIRSQFCGRCDVAAVQIGKAAHAMKTRIDRSFSERNKAYRGLTVCEEWRGDNINFIKWSLSNGWKKGLFLDRRDGAKGYSPDNCRWVTRIVNARNRVNLVTDHENRTRRCGGCKKVKSFDSYHRSSVKSGGIEYCCKTCIKGRDSIRWKNKKKYC